MQKTINATKYIYMRSCKLQVECFQINYTSPVTISLNLSKSVFGSIVTKIDFID
jgi:hypothetical protein